MQKLSSRKIIMMNKPITIIYSWGFIDHQYIPHRETLHINNIMQQDDELNKPHNSSTYSYVPYMIHELKKIEVEIYPENYQRI